MKEERDNTSRGRGLTTRHGLYLSTFQPSQRGFFRVHTFVWRERETEPRIFKLFMNPGINSTELVDWFRICSFLGYSSIHMQVKLIPWKLWHSLKVHGNEADFPRFLHKSIRHIGPLHYLSSRSDFYFEFAEVFVDSPHHQYGESVIEFLKRKLSVSVIQRVVDFPTQRYGESPTPRIVESRVVDSSYRWVREKTTPYRWYGESLIENLLNLSSILWTLKAKLCI